MIEKRQEINLPYNHSLVINIGEGKLLQITNKERNLGTHLIDINISESFTIRAQACNHIELILQ